jgi:hypothetical protein
MSQVMALRDKKRAAAAYTLASKSLGEDCARDREDRKMWLKKSGGALTSVAALLAVSLTSAPTPASALDVDPGDYAAAPPGTSLAIGYSLNSWRREYKTDSGDNIGNSELNTNVGILRLVHYVDLWGITADPQIFLVYGSLNNGKLGGDNLSSSTGIGDTIIASTFWFVNQPENKRWLGFTPFVFLPTGTYRDQQPLNVGENRYKAVLQAGYVEGFEAFGHDWMVDVIYDATIYGDNKDAGPDGNTTLKQDESYQLQTWLRYFLEPNWSIGAGYSGTWGGQTKLGGEDADTSTQAQQLRAITQYNILPDLQLQATIRGDMWSRGGFEETLGVNFRIMKVFGAGD